MPPPSHLSWEGHHLAAGRQGEGEGAGLHREVEEGDPLLLLREEHPEGREERREEGGGERREKGGRRERVRGVM